MRSGRARWLATVAAPVGIAVADARVEEGDGVALAFAVVLSRAASGTLTVDYATADGSAHAGDDYTAASGTLTFAAGERSQKIRVGVLDDAHDEGEETLTLTLTNASSGWLTDGDATGTIENHDPMPRALLARVGRTAAVHVVEHVEERLRAPREPGFRGRFAGRELRRGMERDVALSFLQQLSGGAGAGSMGADPMGAGGGGPLSGAPAAGTAAFGMPGSAGGGGRLAAGGGGPMGMAAGPMDGGFNGGVALGAVGVRSHVSEPERGRRCWQDKKTGETPPEKRAARRPGAVGPGDDGRPRPRQHRAGQPRRCGGQLRAGGREPFGGDAADWLQHVRVRTELPGRVWSGRARPAST